MTEQTAKPCTWSIGTELDDQFLPLAVPNSAVRPQTAAELRLKHPDADTSPAGGAEMNSRLVHLVAMARPEAAR